MSTTTTLPLAGADHAAGQDLARAFQALSDEKRLRIVDILRGGERCVCELVEDLELSQSLLSFHLKTLKEAGLVADRKDGRWVHYSLIPGRLAELEGAIGGLRKDAESCEVGGEGCCG